jgi:hypothetical protein
MIRRPTFLQPIALFQTPAPLLRSPLIALLPVPQLRPLLLFLSSITSHIKIISIILSLGYFLSFLGWGETESTWYVGHCLAYGTRPG